MYFIFLVIACYTMRWSVNVLLGGAELEHTKAQLAFVMGILSAPVAVWTGLHYILI
jgi:hypothetical protein